MLTEHSKDVVDMLWTFY